MAHAPYFELHARSAFSFLRGASRPEALSRRAAAVGLPGIALCDRDGVYGTARLHADAREQGIRPIVGAELTLEDESVLPVLVRTREGYRNLCRLLTQAHLRASKGNPRIRWDELPAHAAGLSALTGDHEGPIHRASIREGKQGVERNMDALLAAFGHEHVYVEIQRHFIREEVLWNRALVDLAGHYRLPLLATNGVCHASPEDRCLLDAFTCIRHHTHLDHAGRLLSQNAERHLCNPESMVERFRDLPQAVHNTVELAEQCIFSLENLGYSFPTFPVPPGESMDSFLRKITWFGAEQRYGSITPRIRDQINHELGIIAKLGFSGYFLIVWDIVNFCRESGIMVQGRGSAANSVVCYSLAITAADPIGGNLLFERFLSEGRQGWPDIDLDLPSGHMRECVIQEVYRRYGKLGAAMTANVITYRGRSAIREMGKALNFPVDQLKRFSDLFAHGDYPQTLALQDQLSQAGIRHSHPRAPALVDLYSRVYGLPRHLGQHSGGMIICQQGLDTIVPLENASMPGRVVVQWDKDDCEDMGIVKVDLLGLGMMAVLQDALALTRARGNPIDLAHIQKDDPATFELMRNADTVGVFQIESRAQMATLPRLQPRTFYDLVIEVAIVRPGPIAGNLAHPYLERRAGRQAIDYIHPNLEPVLKRTLGVPLFQEQVLKMAMVLAGFSGSEAEELRRAMGFKRNDERMERVVQKLRSALESRGVEEDVIRKMTDAIQSFALYGFPESHAISFAILAYGSAYLKTHHPAEFYAGLLNNQPMGFYSPATLVQDGKRHGIRFLPPDITGSSWECTIIDDHTIRLGLLSIDGLKRAHAHLMLAERSCAPFADLRDFLNRTDFARDELRVLAEAGALNIWCGDRRQALWAIEQFHDSDDLFASLPQNPHAGDPSETRPLPPMDPIERLMADYRTIGLTVGAHPMSWIRPLLGDSVVPAGKLAQMRDGCPVRVAGAVICRQRPGTAKGAVFVSLEDETGIANCILYSDRFERYRLTVTQEHYLIVSGRLQRKDGVTHIQAIRLSGIPLKALPAVQSYDFH